jgi:hypothetical protein
MYFFRQCSNHITTAYISYFFQIITKLNVSFIASMSVFAFSTANIKGLFETNEIKEMAEQARNLLLPTKNLMMSLRNEYNLH